MASGRDEKFIETADGYLDQNGVVTANERAMTRRILLNLDFRYEILILANSISYLSSSLLITCPHQDPPYSSPALPVFVP
jgi:hypothetical protein